VSARSTTQSTTRSTTQSTTQSTQQPTTPEEPMQLQRAFSLAACAAALSLAAAAASALEITSTDVEQGKAMPRAQEFQGFGCDGGNVSPALAWKGAPEGTKSFALTVYDPDAPTGSGWWHWVVYDIPATATGLARGTTAASLPAGAHQGRNDFGARDFGGACPPQGHGVHHYHFVVHALKVDKLGVADDATAALIGYMIHANELGSADLTALYQR
jgi:Raf kinase inhibitor-like YbhB/YbcL family protein